MPAQAQAAGCRGNPSRMVLKDSLGSLSSLALWLFSSYEPAPYVSTQSNFSAPFPTSSENNVGNGAENYSAFCVVLLHFSDPVPAPAGVLGSHWRRAGVRLAVGGELQCHVSTEVGEQLLRRATQLWQQPMANSIKHLYAKQDLHAETADAQEKPAFNRVGETLTKPSLFLSITRLQKRTRFEPIPSKRTHF